MSQLSEAIQEMRNMREAYDDLLNTSEVFSPELSAGKTALATAITAKGQTTSPTDSLATMADNISLIQQESYTIDGGEMYAKQLFGSLTTPNYWNLYEVMAQLLSDGRFVNYGGILLAEYYKGYATIALSGAGAGGGYVTSDGQYYTEDVIHTWNDDTDGKGNRWIAYLFGSEYHDFNISDYDTSPRSIHIGRKVGTINCLTNTRIAEVTVTDGNELYCFNGGWHTHNFQNKIVLRNLQHQDKILYSSVHETLYVQSKFIGYSTSDLKLSSTIILDADEINGGSYYGAIGPLDDYGVSTAIVKVGKLEGVLFRGPSQGTLKNISIKVEETDAYAYITTQGSTAVERLYIGYIDNDKTKSVLIRCYQEPTALTKLELQPGYCKSVDISQVATPINEAGIYAGVLQNLKQDEEDCGDGVTITLGSTNLAKLTSEESVALLNSLTNTYGYTFA